MGGKDIVVGFDVASLFTNETVNEDLRVTKKLLAEDQTLTERIPLQINIMELLETSLKTTCFQVEDKFFQQKQGISMLSSLSPVISNI
jgi:hypothetical protein